jgi:hypothetical protein
MTLWGRPGIHGDQQVWYWFAALDGTDAWFCIGHTRCLGLAEIEEIIPDDLGYLYALCIMAGETKENIAEWGFLSEIAEAHEVILELNKPFKDELARMTQDEIKEWSVALTDGEDAE